MPRPEIQRRRRWNPLDVLQTLSEASPTDYCMDVDPSECMFCHEGLPEAQDEPVNLAFMSHLEGREPCQKAFDAWRQNMETDYLGG